MWKSRDKESTTSFSSPENYWGYMHDTEFMVILATCRAATSFTVVSVSDSLFSLKLDLQSQPVFNMFPDVSEGGVA